MSKFRKFDIINNENLLVSLYNIVLCGSYGLLENKSDQTLKIILSDFTVVTVAPHTTINIENIKLARYLYRNKFSCEFEPCKDIMPENDCDLEF